MRLNDLPKAVLQDCTAEEALSELQREYQVRQRCFPKWIDDGRITKFDAKDRLRRMAAAVEFLDWIATWAKLMEDSDFMPGTDVPARAGASAVPTTEATPF